MSDLHDLFLCVPIGAENAMTGREIWKAFGDKWSQGWAENYLRAWLTAGTVQRLKRTIPSGFAWTYYRA